MKRADQIAGALLLLLSLVALFESSKLPMFSGSTPGRGFLPFWVSLSMAALSGVLLLDGLRRSSDQRRIAWPNRLGLRGIGVTIAGLLAYVYLTPLLGFAMSTFALLWLLVWLLGSYRWYWSAGMSLALSVGFYLVFQVWLGVALPRGLPAIP